MARSVAIGGKMLTHGFELQMTAPHRSRTDICRSPSSPPSRTPTAPALRGARSRTQPVQWTLPHFGDLFLAGRLRFGLPARPFHTDTAQILRLTRFRRDTRRSRRASGGGWALTHRIPGHSNGRRGARMSAASLSITSRLVWRSAPLWRRWPTAALPRSACRIQPGNGSRQEASLSPARARSRRIRSRE